MNVTGIIAEYNPFHNGHHYQIEQIRQKGTDFIIIVMSGDFLQRGTPAILDKWTRAHMALSAGADLVIELPAVFATASAQYFARGGVSILDKLGVVDTISFGCETDDLSLLKRCSSYLWKEPVDYKEKLQSLLKEGNSFPKAREEALTSYLGAEAATLVSSPNNILALEYCVALLERNSAIEPMPILRKGNSYHEETLTLGTLPSATAIRELLAKISANNQTIESTSTTVSKQNATLKNGINAETFTWDFIHLSEIVPQSVASILKENRNKLLLSKDALSLLLKYKLLLETNSLDRYADVTPDLADKIKKNLNQFENYSQFTDLLKSKDLTHTRITRALTHILLNISQDMYTDVKTHDYASYARVLGFHRRALPLLSAIGKNASIPLITKLADAHTQLSKHDYTLLEHDIFCSHVYESIIADKIGTPFQNEFTRQIVICE